MQSCFLDKQSKKARALVPVCSSCLDNWLDSQPSSSRHWVRANQFKASPGTACPIPSPEHSISCILVGVQKTDPWCLAGLPYSLPQGDYYLDKSGCANNWDTRYLTRVLTGWGLGAYRFTRYKKSAKTAARLVIPSGCDRNLLDAIVSSVTLTRDLINTPAEDMMPEQLGSAVEIIAEAHGGNIHQTVGDELLKDNFPAIHRVGRASVHPPRLIDMTWGNPAHPKVTLIGKGVCFDSGGLDLKPSKGMRLMKKDMGGAAHAIALANLVMQTTLPVRLRLLVPAVENAVAGNSYRPGDIITTRTGITVEIDNTDAEGRVILSDVLSEAAAQMPDLMIDFATLTGAARVAVGTELPAMFCNEDEVAHSIRLASVAESDEVWQLPLHTPYRELIESKIADIVNSATSPFGGAISAALFLKEFVPDSVPWVHFDLMAWNVRSRPGRPEGGEAMGLRALYEFLKTRYV